MFDPQHDVLVQPLAPQIQKAIGQPRFLRIIQVAEHRQRQFLRRPCTWASSMRSSISPVGRSLLTVSAVRATTWPVRVSTHSERAVSTSGEGRAVRLDHALGDAVMVAQVDEDQPAMIAAAVDPAGQAHGLADVGLREAGRKYGSDRRAWAKTFEERAGFGGLWGVGQGRAVNRPIFPVIKGG